MDGSFGLLFLCLLVFFFLTGNKAAMLLRQEAAIDQAYLTKQGADGSYYVVDQGHERMLCLSGDDQYRWQINTPEGSHGTALYVDDIAIASDGTTYVQVSDWDGMFNRFVYYFVPIFCDELGQGETTVSLLLMGYALFAVYLSGAVTRFMDRVAGRKAMYAVFALNIGAVMLFAWLQTLATALVLMGLSASFGKTVQQNYFMELRAVKQFGED